MMNCMAGKYRRVALANVHEGSEAEHPHRRDSVRALHHSGKTSLSKPRSLKDVFVPCEFHLPICRQDQTVERLQVFFPIRRIRSHLPQHVLQQGQQAWEAPDKVMGFLYVRRGKCTDGLQLRVQGHGDAIVAKVATQTVPSPFGPFQEARFVAVPRVKHVLGEGPGARRSASARPYSPIHIEVECWCRSWLQADRIRCRDDLKAEHQS